MRSTMQVPALLAAAGERAGICFLEFCAANIRDRTLAVAKGAHGHSPALLGTPETVAKAMPG